MREKHEQYLNSLTKEKRELLTEQLKHAVSFCRLNGELWPTPMEKENLFEVVAKMERYVVDTNSSWQAESAKPENRDKAFILGKTIADEQDNLQGLLFGPKVKIHHKNIFLLSVFQAGNRNDGDFVMLERLDQYFHLVFDPSSLLQGSKPKKERTDKKSLEYEQQFKAGVEHERAVALLLLGKIKTVSELPPPQKLEKKRAQFLAFIQKESSMCSGNYLKAVGVARHCYALLLMEKRSIRTEFSKEQNFNIFGDTRIIQNALFMQAKILSGDKPLKRMATYAGLECVKSIP